MARLNEPPALGESLEACQSTYLQLCALLMTDSEKTFHKAEPGDRESQLDTVHKDSHTRMRDFATVIGEHYTTRGEHSTPEAAGGRAAPERFEEYLGLQEQVRVESAGTQ